MAVCEWISALYFFTVVRLTHPRSSPDQLTWKQPVMASMRPLSPSITSSGPVIPCLANSAARVQQAARFG